MIKGFVHLREHGSAMSSSGKTLASTEEGACGSCSASTSESVDRQLLTTGGPLFSA